MRPVDWKVSVVIPAAGVGRRMGSTTPKQFLSVSGESILRRTLVVLANMTFIDCVVVACAPEYRDQVRACAEGLWVSGTVFEVVDGGAERQDSVRLGLAHPGLGPLVAIHDAVRPNISQELMVSLCEEALRVGAAVPVVGCRDTVKRSIDGKQVLETLDRNEIWLAQTPQVFNTEQIRLAHQKALMEGFRGTDDASIMEYAGYPVHLVPGSPDNIKITEPVDLTRLKQLSEETPMITDIRIGYGYDVHSLEQGRKLMLGGIELPHESGLKGHSDADALLHAITDAILGALALGDIGSHFPDTDSRYKDMSSRVFLEHARDLASAQGYTISNLDATVVAEAPKLRPYIDTIRGHIGVILSLDPDRISVKATTSEKMGFVGRKEGMAVMATVSLIKTT
jgi:2-C-methyl-D-erythritol 4-phosphate cytidylyltransferase/2-C-methyl-D-erythritol 2,4-cyclodiphosphate synthase